LQEVYCFILEARVKLDKKIRERLSEISQDSVIREMGYGSMKIGAKTLKTFLNTNSVYVWLKNGHYDMRYSSEPFVWRLVEVLDISLDIASVDIAKAKKRYNLISMMKSPYIQAETNFKRRGESIFALSWAFAKGRIDIDKESCIYRSDEEIFDHIGVKVRRHYARYQGGLPIFGNIIYYIYNHTDGKRYLFDYDGKFKGYL